MKCQILFSGENKKNITSLSSAELAKRVVNVKEFWRRHWYICDVSVVIIRCRILNANIFHERFSYLISHGYNCWQLSHFY